MAQKYFRYVPNFDYVSRLENAKSISEYVQTKNLFKRAELRPDIFNDLSYFTKYKVIGDERPDQVAYKVYDDENLDWLMMLCNNMINPLNEWPLSQESFDNYLTDKYGSSEKIYAVQHYESIQVKNSDGKEILPAGKEVPQDFSVSFYDKGIQQTATDITSTVTNYDYENKIQEERRNIFILKDTFISLIIDDLERIMPYKPGSSQYVSPSVVKGENIRLFQ